MPVGVNRNLRVRDGKKRRVASRILDELLDVRTEIAAAVRMGQRAPAGDLQEREQKLSRELAREIDSPEIEECTTLDSVRKRLDKAVLIEIARFEVIQNAARKGKGEKYVAWIIPPLGK